MSKIIDQNYFKYYEYSTFDYYGIINCTFERSSGGLGGSITLLEGSSLFFKNLIFCFCQAKSGGALLLKERTWGYLFYCDFHNTRAEDMGGAISSLGYFLLVSNSVSNNSEASSGGGFLHKSEGRCIIEYSRFLFSEADMGGSLFISFSTLELNYLYFDSNYAYSSGGAIFSKKSLLEVMRASFLNCSAVFQGSALYSLSARSLFMQKVLLKYCNINEGGVYLLDRDGLSLLYFVNNLECSLSQGSGIGTCLLAAEVGIVLKNIILCKNVAVKSMIHLSSSKDNINRISIQDISAQDCKIEDTLIFISRIYFEIKNFVIKNRNIMVLSNDLYSSAINCLLGSIGKLENIFYEPFNEAEIFLTSSASHLNLSNITLNLKHKSAAFSFQESSKANLSYSSIFRGYRQDYAGGISVDGSEVTLFHMLITDTHGNKGGAIHSASSMLIFVNTVLVRNSAKAKGSSIHGLDLSSFVLINVTILDNSEISIFLFNIRSVKMVSVTMRQTFKLSPSQAFLVEEAEEIFLLSCNVIGFWVMNSVKVSTKSGNNKLYLLIANSTFKNNDCAFSGGALYLDSHNLSASIIDSKFLNNSSNGSGGAIYFRCPTYFCELEIKTSHFFKNTARLYPSVVKSDQIAPLSIGNTFVDNSGVPGSPDFMLFPSKILIFPGYQNKVIFLKALLEKGVVNITKESTNILKNISPGQRMFLICLVIDEFGNFFLNENVTSSITLKEFNNSLINLENNTQIITKGLAIFSNLIINAWPGKYFEILAIYKNEREGYFFNQTLAVEIRPCVKGEFVSGLKCKICPRAFYSLEPFPKKATQQNATDNSCEACPLNAECPGGKVILPNKDYWLRDENQSKVIKCPIKGACDYQDISEIVLEQYSYSPKCAEGYFGNLCFNCKSGFGRRASDKNCIKCSESFSIYFMFFLTGLLSVAFILYQSRSAFSMTIIESKRRALIKILVDHVTYISFISRFDINWTTYINEFFSINDRFVSTASKEIFNFDCFISQYIDERDIFIRNEIIVSLSPFIYGGVVLVLLYFWYFLKHYYSTVQFKIKTNTAVIPFSKNLLSISIIVFYNFYHRLLMSSLNFFKCLKIDDSDTTFLEANPDLRCWESLHVSYVLSISFPSIIIWGLGGPLTLFWLTIKMSETKSASASHGTYNHLFNFLTIDYVNKLYYWEFFTYFSKFLIVTSTLAASHLDPVSQGALLILVYLSFFLLHQSLKPYRFDFINKLKTFSYLTTISTSSFAIISSYQFLSDTERAFYIFIVFFGNLIFYSVWFCLFLQNIKHEGLEIFKFVTEFFKKKISKGDELKN